MICQWICEDKPAEQTFKCEVGCNTILGAFGVWIKSPRTGNVIGFDQSRWTELPNNAAKRIMRACGFSGKATVDFTKEELAAFANLHATKPVKAELPRLQYPLPNFGSRRRR